MFTKLFRFRIKIRISRSYNHVYTSADGLSFKSPVRSYKLLYHSVTPLVFQVYFWFGKQIYKIRSTIHSSCIQNHWSGQQVKCSCPGVIMCIWLVNLTLQTIIFKRELTLLLLWKPCCIHTQPLPPVSRGYLYKTIDISNCRWVFNTIKVYLNITYDCNTFQNWILSFNVYTRCI